MPSTINADNGVSSGSAGLKSTADSSGVLSLQTNGTTAVTVDTSQNVGIGTSSPATPLCLGNNKTLSWLNAAGNLNGTTTGTQLLKFTDNNLYIDNLDASTNIIFRRNGPTESMRIDSSGNLLVGTTTAGGRLTALASGSGTAGYFASSGSVAAIAVVDSGANGANVALYGNGATTPNKYLRAQSGGFEIVNSGYSATIMRVADAGVYSTAVGATNRVMYVDNSNVIGYLSSVRASKTNIAPMPATDWLLQLQPKTFNYRKKNADGKYTDEADGGIQYGLIAEEVEQVKPDLCFYDEVDGKQELRGIHYEKLVVPMLRAIQELKAEVDSLKSQLAAKG